MREQDYTAVCRHLHGIAYPCQRATLLEHAAARGADADQLGILGALPDRRYESFDDLRGTIVAEHGGAR